jgi:glycosyltransferase involved in cell wall biosynthesis
VVKAGRPWGRSIQFTNFRPSKLVPFFERPTAIASRRELGGKMTRLLVMVPVFNEALILEQHVARIVEFLRLKRQFQTCVLIVDSSDRDRTPEIARSLCERFPELEHQRFESGGGKGEKLREGARAREEYEVFAFIDADLPIPLEEWWELVTRVAERQTDIAIASKYLSGSTTDRPFHRTVLSLMVNAFLRRALEVPFSDMSAGAKAWNAEVTRQLLPKVQSDRFLFDVELLFLAHHAGFHIEELPVHYEDGRLRPSKANLISMASEVLKCTLELRGRPEFRSRAVEGGARRTFKSS